MVEEDGFHSIEHVWWTSAKERMGKGDKTYGFGSVLRYQLDFNVSISLRLDQQGPQGYF